MTSSTQFLEGHRSNFKCLRACSQANLWEKTDFRVGLQEPLWVFTLLGQSLIR